MKYILILQLLGGYGFEFSDPLPRDVCLLQSLVVEEAASNGGLLDDEGRPVNVEYAFCRPVGDDEQES